MCFHHTETIQLIGIANKLAGFYDEKIDLSNM